MTARFPAHRTPPDRLPVSLSPPLRRPPVGAVRSGREGSYRIALGQASQASTLPIASALDKRAAKSTRIIAGWALGFFEQSRNAALVEAERDTQRTRLERERQRAGAIVEKG